MVIKNQNEFRQSFRVLVGSVGALLCVVAALVVYLLHESYQRYQASAEESSQNVALSLETFLNAHFLEMDLALQDAAGAFQRMHADGHFTDAAFSAYLRSLRQRLPNAASVRGANKEGRLIYGEGVNPAHPISLLDREFFLRAWTYRKLLFGLPLTSRITGERVLPIVQPLSMPDGSFGGAAYVNTTNDRLLSLFASIKLGKSGVITLFNDRHIVLVRYPPLSGAASGETAIVADPGTIAALASNLPATYRTLSAFDGHERTMTLRRIGNYPVYLAVGLARDDFMQAWKTEASVGGVLFLLLAGSACIFCMSIRRRWLADLQMRSLQATQIAYDHLAAVMAAIPDSLFEMDINGRYLASPGGRNSSGGLSADELAGRNVYEVMPAEAAQTVMRALAEARREGRSCGAQLHFQNIGGDTWIELSVARKDDHDGGEPTLIVLSRNITERKQAQAQIEQLAFSDLLTGLPNRRLFLDRLKHSMANSQHGSRSVGALLFLDLDQFKVVNDTMGHHFGDLLLVKTAQRLSELTRQHDTVARLGGDEFVIILEQLSDSFEKAASLAMLVAEEIVHALDAQYELYDRPYHSTVSIGVTLFRGQDVAMDEVLKRADMSMYQAKLAGRNAVRFFDPQTQTAIEARLEMEMDLQLALRADEFILHYQPQIDGCGNCVGVEALIRWSSRQRGFVQPAEFIPLAETTGLICRIGNWVLREACAQLKRWQGRSEFAHLTIAVNVSARQFAQAGFVEEVCDVVQEYGVDPALLKLELTESMLVEQVDEVAARMIALRDMGITFSLDDFGTGFSSLSYLKRLPFAQIKIDRSFALDVLIDANDAAICHAIIALGKSLGLEVIAEGIETAEQWSFLNDAGCSHAQGYMIGRPMSAADFDTWMLLALKGHGDESVQATTASV